MKTYLERILIRLEIIIIALVLLMIMSARAEAFYDMEKPFVEKPFYPQIQPYQYTPREWYEEQRRYAPQQYRAVPPHGGRRPSHLQQFEREYGYDRY